MPAPVRLVVEHAYGDATALVFLIAAGIAVIAFVAVLLMRETTLRTTVGDGELAEMEQTPARA